MSSETTERETTFAALLQEVAVAGIHSRVDVEPHDFQPLKRWRNRGRCVACLIHEDYHPAYGWLPARPHGDMTEAISLRVAS